MSEHHRRTPRRCRARLGRTRRWREDPRRRIRRRGPWDPHERHSAHEQRGGHALFRRRPQDPAPAAACGAREAAGRPEPQNGGGQHSTAHEAALGPCGARGHQEAALALQAVVVSGCGPSQQGTRGVLHEEQQRPDPAWRGACGRGQSAETHPDELDQGQRRPDLCCGARARVRQQRVRGAGGRPYEQIALGAGSMRSGGLCSEAGKE